MSAPKCGEEIAAERDHAQQVIQRVAAERDEAERLRAEARAAFEHEYAAAARNARQRDATHRALRRYGQHDGSCNAWRGHGELCSCGLTDALAGDSCGAGGCSVGYLDGMRSEHYWQSAALEMNAENQALAQALHACERRHGRAVSTAQGQAKRAIELADQVRRMRSRLMAIAATCKNDDDAPKVLSLIWNLAQDALDHALAPSPTPGERA